MTFIARRLANTAPRGDAGRRPPRAHDAFLAVVFVEGLDGALESLAGLLIAVAGPWWLYSTVVWTVAPELSNSLGDHAARVVQHGAGQLTQSSTFAIVYLLTHGPLKLALAICLVRGRMWNFPFASAVLLGFVAYLTYRAA